MYFRSISLKDNEKLIGSKQRLWNELDNIRRENFLLTSTVLKCNEEIKSLLNKQQLMMQTIKELQTDWRKLEKKNCDLEEKLQLNIKEIRLIYDDFDKIKRSFFKLNTKLANVDSIIANDNGSKSIKTDSDSSFNSNNLSSINNKKTVDKLNLIQQRMEQLEEQIANLAEQNNDVYFQLNSHFKQAKLNDDINGKVEQKLQYMNDLSQLLQYRLYMMDIKINEPHRQTGNKMVNGSDIASQNRFLFQDRLKALAGTGTDFLFNRNSTTIPTEQQTTSGLEQFLRSGINNNTLKTDFIPDNNKTSTMNHRSISVSAIPTNSNSANNSNTIPTATGSRRCHHRIKLFPNRRRRC